MRVIIGYFKDSIDLLVKGACRAVMIYINITGCVGITGYLSETFFLYLLRKTLFL